MYAYMYRCRKDPFVAKRKATGLNLWILIFGIAKSPGRHGHYQNDANVCVQLVLNANGTSIICKLGAPRRKIN
uniref:Uncharacterized protein n=1 Tax=Rhizophora mucronata TaxID=61149 RepID=A0A2P2J3E9_RHIMU